MFALKSGAKVVPVVIHNKYSFFTRPCISIGTPVDTASFSEGKRTSEVIAKTTDHLRESFVALKNRPWKGTTHAAAGC